MTMSWGARRGLGFGEDALGFVRRELSAAAQDFAGPLATRLLALELAAPFSFLKPDTASAAQEWRRGGIDDGGADACLASAISWWLHQSDAGHRRLIALEEPLGRYADPSIESNSMHFGERVYHTASAGDGTDEVARAFNELSGYPGVGVLSRPPAGAIISDELRDDALDALADAAVAVLVRAWDDEAFLIVPVAAAPILDDLRCAPNI